MAESKVDLERFIILYLMCELVMSIRHEGKWRLVRKQIVLSLGSGVSLISNFQIQFLKYIYIYIYIYAYIYIYIFIERMNMICILIYYIV